MNASPRSQEIAILLFRILETPMGIDARQIARTSRPTPDTEAELYYFHQRLPCNGRIPDYHSPVILHPAPHLGVSGGLIVDHLEEMRTLEHRAIRRLPRWLTSSSQPTPYWGVAYQEDGLILLLDLSKLLPLQSTQSDAITPPADCAPCPGDRSGQTPP
ncbi:MAG: hypothetical protein H7836_06880 [Magnetococcus sp. YQC-3]